MLNYFMLKTLIIIKHVDMLFEIQKRNKSGSKVLKTKNGRIMLSSKSAVCRNQDLRSNKKQKNY